MKKYGMWLGWGAVAIIAAIFAELFSQLGNK